MGSGNNTFVSSGLLAGNTTNSQFTFGNGNNTITFAADQAAPSGSTFTTSGIGITVGTGLNTINLGSGHASTDSITFSAANAGSTTSYTTISNIGGTNGGASTDFINFASAPINASNTTLGTVTSIQSGVTTAQTSSAGYSTFVFNGNTFVYENSGLTSTSELVALVGTSHNIGYLTTGIVITG